MAKEQIGIGSKAAGQEDEIGLSRVAGYRVLTVVSALKEKAGELAFVEWAEVDVHAVGDEVIVRQGGKRCRG